MADMEPASWLKSTRAAEGSETGKAMFAILSAFLSSQLERRVSIVAAAEDLNSLYKAHTLDYPSRLPIRFMWMFWDLLFHVAMQVSYEGAEQERLVELVKRLQVTRPEEFMGEATWESLPYARMASLDALDEIICNTPEELNYHSFVARLSRDAIMPQYSWAIWSLCDALEEEPGPHNLAYRTQGPMLDSLVSIAAQWILIAGKQIFSQIHNPQSRRVSSTVGGRLLKENKELSLNRWKLWRGRFGDIAVFEHASEKTRQLAKEAEKEMAVIEEIEEGGEKLSGSL